jgi:hypothetical protein
MGSQTSGSHIRLTHSKRGVNDVTEPANYSGRAERPARATRRLSYNDWLTRMDEAAGAFNGLPRPSYAVPCR